MRLTDLFPGATYLGSCISKLNKGLVHLNLAHCGLSSKGVNNLFSALCNNSNCATTLTFLNLSGNSLKDDITVRIDIFSANCFL